MRQGSLLVLAFVAVAAAAPPQSSPTQQRVERQSLLQRGVGAIARLLGYESTSDGSGNYRFSYQQDDGTKREEQGEVKNPGAENQYVVVKGAYSWVDPDGVTYNVKYTADENGYQPEIEQGPGGGVPPAIIASLAGG